MKNFAKKFKEFAQGTREDFHEPDEQDIRLLDIVGRGLDNAMGDRIIPELLEKGYHEAVVIVQKGSKVYNFNLASIMALAKKGAEAYEESDYKEYQVIISMDNIKEVFYYSTEEECVKAIETLESRNFTIESAKRIKQVQSYCPSRKKFVFG
jgi:hypothetical protein